MLLVYFAILILGVHPKRMRYTDIPPVDTENLTNTRRYLGNVVRWDVSYQYSLTGSRIGLSTGTKIGSFGTNYIKVVEIGAILSVTKT